VLSSLEKIRFLINFFDMRIQNVYLYDWRYYKLGKEEYAKYMNKALMPQYFLPVSPR